MSERKNLIHTFPLELPPSITGSVRKNRVVMNQVFMSVMRQAQEQPEEFNQPLVEMVKRPAKPDGTGQIINIGI
jgi:hypothetical protein